MTKVDIAVGGRFHAEYMARALLMDHQVQLFCSLPRFRFPSLPPKQVTPLITGEVVFRGLRAVGLGNLGDVAKILIFGSQMGRRARSGRYADIFIGWSSFSLEAIRSSYAARNILVRDSFHILTQTEILKHEYHRRGAEYADRSVVERRECEEYDLADEIWVPSRLARQSFIDRGFSPDKVRAIYLGVDASTFTPSNRVWRKSEPLRVVFFGSVNVRKGIPYLLEACDLLMREKRVELNLVGPCGDGMQNELKKYPFVKWHAPLPHPKLAALVREMDVFVLPSLEDGFGLVLIQAMASGLAPVATDACGASEVIRNGENGFVVRAADSGAIRAALEKLLSDEGLVGELKTRARQAGGAFSWDAYATRVREAVASHPIPSATAV